MEKKGFLHSLPFRLVLTLIIGLVAGLAMNGMEDSALPTGTLNVIVTVKYIAGQFISLCVPLVVVGFIAPSITRMGSNTPCMLGVTLSIAYVSSIGAAFSSTIAGSSILPHLSINPNVDGLRKLPDVTFQLQIPPAMTVMTVLFLPVTVGLAAVWNHAEYTTNLLEEFQKIVFSIVTKLLILVLPFLIGTTFCALVYGGSITKQLPIFLVIIVIVMIGHHLWLTLLYGIASVYPDRNGLNILKHYGPAYMTAIGTMSSAATLPVALQCARKLEPTLHDSLVDPGIPLLANIHLCGSVMTETFFAITVSKMLYGELPSVGKMVLFCLLLGVFATGASGVPGGTVMVPLGLITGVLGFDETGTAFILTIFALQGSFNTACNVTGDGALTLILTGYVEKYGVRKAELGDAL